MEQTGLRLEVAQDPKSLLKAPVQKICQKTRVKLDKN